MPEKILDLLEKSSLTKDQIAEALHISDNELSACLEYLTNMGFIKSIFINPTGGSCSGKCGGNCGKCNASGHTVSGSGYTIWEII